jgi:CRISPR-associated protein Csd1
MMQVPRPAKRTAGIAPNFLWDKTAYALGVTAGEGKRTAQEHAAFIRYHRDTIGAIQDAGLKAFLLFLDNWIPAHFTTPLWPEEMKDQNVVFILEDDRRQNIFLHDRPAAQAAWARSGNQKNDVLDAICLVTGEAGPVARLHPAIKNVWGAQSSGASIVSFNLDAFASYNHEQGDNAPVSEAAAFKYTTALNTFLASDSKNRIQIGDASTVFWADASDADLVGEAESIFGAMLNAIDVVTEDQKIGAILGRIRKGERLSDFNPGLSDGVRFYVLGLAPNAARISIRFWFEDTFGRLAENYQRYIADTAIAPPPREGYPPLWRYLVETAVLGKRENVPPNLAGDWMRSILAGTHYPATLFSTVLMRIRADKDINALRVGMLRAVLIRNFDRTKEAPVSLDPENDNKGYLLGRLFAAYEKAQTEALGRNVNATIKDKFYGAASATPRRVFTVLDKGSANHLSKVGKQNPGRRKYLDTIIGAILDRMNPNNDPFPASLSAQDQALFGLGYYHQRNAFFIKSDTTASEAADSDTTGTEDANS